MEKALQYIEDNKVWDEKLNTFALSVIDAQRAVEISVNTQLTETMKELQDSLGVLGLDSLLGENE